MLKRNNFLFSSWFMGVLFIIFAFAMGIATFIENDYGAMAARELVYNTKWFELLFLLMIVNFIGHIFRYKLYRLSKLPGMLFHLAFVLIIIGAAITRYIGYEGMMHLREGETKNTILTNDQYIKLRVKGPSNETLYSSDKKFILTPVSSDDYEETALAGGTEYNVRYKGYIPHATEAIVDAPGGTPMVLLTVTQGRRSRSTVILEQGQRKEIQGLTLGFNKKGDFDIQISQKADSFFISSPHNLSRLSMREREAEAFAANQPVPLQPMFVYNLKGLRIVAQKMTTSGISRPMPSRSRTADTRDVLEFEVNTGEKSEDLYLWLNRDSSNVATFPHKDRILELSYAPKSLKLPFQLKLNDFILERYPGSNTPSSYKSDVVLIDENNNVRKPFMIYMNNVLKYKGYRFYQSSYEQDEKGSILSVNHDVAGMGITYAGYFSLFLFIILSMINKKSVFRKVNENYWKTPVKKGTAILALLLLSGSLTVANAQNLKVDKKIAQEMGEVLVQDHKGRTKPLFTQSNDILRKVNRSTSFYGLSSMQVFLGYYYDFENWKDVPIIKVGHKDIQNIIGIDGEYAAFTDLVMLEHNHYKLREHVKQAYEKPENKRNKLDKKIMKVDERVNICFMMMTGEFLKVFPYRNNTDKWGTPKEAIKFAPAKEDSLFIENILGMVHEAIYKDNEGKALEYINALRNYQRKHASYELPSQSKVKAEIFYYKSHIFERLFPYYATAGLIFLILIMARIISGKRFAPWLVKILIGLIALGFAFHTIGLAIRWYISGHAPMSNGYESMIFVSWVTVLAGFLFTRKSKLTLAATSILASLTLMVAHLSFMDPEITNLVPVLKSYWLTLHVSIITGSYGFLGMGAILGLICLILYSIVDEKNHTRIISTIQNLTVINYRALTIGLYLLTIGTFLGAIWANESWGRYWGWDPKETWSLITIIVYSFIIHARMIPGLKTLFSFNVLALFGFSSVLMTYFGVNYYLSGLHSYAGGDPVPVPVFVYIATFVLITLAIVAYMNKRNKLELKSK